MLLNLEDMAELLAMWTILQAPKAHLECRKQILTTDPIHLKYCHLHAPARYILRSMRTQVMKKMQQHQHETSLKLQLVGDLLVACV
ncbi:hypothetical protein KSP40_PGU007702 [Platanthera guangdongensis]|uniref:Uncharacterized protein n=1 Tax=Platanthera guangdongensis TaxID=2320717 RepID=A0ABR2LQU5_9ASPA